MKLYDGGVFLLKGKCLISEKDLMEGKVSEIEAKVSEMDAALTEGLSVPEGKKLSEVLQKDAARKGTIAYGILNAHNESGTMEKLKLHFDSMASHDITYVGIIQTARASGMERFPLPYVLTCCHNSLCAVGGTINDDDHLFGLSAAKKYGGIYVPPHLAVIHQYMREMFAGCGKMILGSDSHTRYGALGTLAVGEGGGELTKQLLKQTYDIAYPGVVAVYLKGKPAACVGPHDVALAIVKAVFGNGYVKNKVMEFVGPGVSALSADFRIGVDVMTTETTCLSSIWRTDDEIRNYLSVHGRPEDYRELNPADAAYYDGCIEIDLSEIQPMIALPFHPSNAFTIRELQENMQDILRETELAAEKVGGGKASLHLLDKLTEDGRLKVQQGVIGGCAGGSYSNILEASQALRGKAIGNGEFYLSIYPSSQPVYTDLDRKGYLADLMDSGAIIRSAFCGPCFGAGDTPANDCLSVRHTTRNFPNREGSKPGQGQLAAVALMDARSIAATAAAGGVLTSAEELDCWGEVPAYHFNDSSYRARVYQGYGKPEEDTSLRLGPNIKDWPVQQPLTEHILLKLVSKILDPVTTTDELIPSGETSSYRSNPLGLAEFTLSRRDPEYVGRAKAVRDQELLRREGKPSQELCAALQSIRKLPGMEALTEGEVETGSALYAVKPGDGSAREQAASCQRVLGGLANIVQDYATKRYRSNCINWGLLPLHLKEDPSVLERDDLIFLPGIRTALMNNRLEDLVGYVLRDGSMTEIHLYMQPMTENERNILMDGCLINFNRNRRS